MFKKLRKVVLATLAVGMLFMGVSLSLATPAEAAPAARCTWVTHWRVNQTGDTNVRWTAGGANAGSIFINATLVGPQNDTASASGFLWHRGRIGGPNAAAHNGWINNTMWAVRARFVNQGQQCV